MNVAYVVRSVLRAMAYTVLATICFLACVFLLFVLVQWMRDTKRKTTTRPKADSKAGETQEQKRLHTVGVQGTVQKRNRFKVRAHRVSAITEGRANANLVMRSTSESPTKGSRDRSKPTRRVRRKE
jgi:hypothetical protein